MPPKYPKGKENDQNVPNKSKKNPTKSPIRVKSKEAPQVEANVGKTHEKSDPSIKETSAQADVLQGNKVSEVEASVEKPAEDPGASTGDKKENILEVEAPVEKAAEEPSTSTGDEKVLDVGTPVEKSLEEPGTSTGVENEENVSETSDPKGIKLKVLKPLKIIHCANRSLAKDACLKPESTGGRFVMKPLVNNETSYVRITGKIDLDITYSAGTTLQPYFVINNSPANLFDLANVPSAKNGAPPKSSPYVSKGNTSEASTSPEDPNITEKVEENSEQKAHSELETRPGSNVEVPTGTTEIVAEQ